MKVVRMPVVSPRGVHFGFWCHLGCSRTPHFGNWYVSFKCLVEITYQDNCQQSICHEPDEN